MSLAQTRAAWHGAYGDVGVFERTPKRGEDTRLVYGVRTHGSWALELAFAAWQLVGVGVAASFGGWGGGPIHALVRARFSLIGATTARESLGVPRTA